VVGEVGEKAEERRGEWAGWEGERKDGAGKTMWGRWKNNTNLSCEWEKRFVGEEIV
jgi:hypothetical protein